MKKWFIENYGYMLAIVLFFAGWAAYRLWIYPEAPDFEDSIDGRICKSVWEMKQIGPFSLFLIAWATACAFVGGYVQEYIENRQK